MSIYEAVIDLIGIPPVGYEPLVWVSCVIFGLFLVTSAFSIISAIINWIGGRSH